MTKAAEPVPASLSFIEDTRKYARKEARKRDMKLISGNPEPFYFLQMCFLPWTEYEQNHTPKSKHPKVIYPEGNLMEHKLKCPQGVKGEFHMLGSECKQILESETKILGYYWEVY